MRLQGGSGPEPSAKDLEAAAVIAESAAAANARQQRKDIPTQGDFFMPGDEAGAAQVVIWIFLPLVSHPGAQNPIPTQGNFCMPSD